MSKIYEIENLERFILNEDIKSKLECPNCKSEIVCVGTRTAEPWPEDELLYHVEAYSCKKCNKLFEYWPEDIRD